MPGNVLDLATNENFDSNLTALEGKIQRLDEENGRDGEGGGIVGSVGDGMNNISGSGNTQ